MNFKTLDEANQAKSYHLANNGIVYDVQQNIDGSYTLVELGRGKIKFEKEKSGKTEEYRKSLEDAGYTVLSKQEEDALLNKKVEEIVSKMLQKEKSSKLNKFYNNIIQPSDEDDLAKIEELRNSPKVAMSITIKRNNKGESEEHKRPFLREGVPIVNGWNKQAVLENFISGSINTIPFTISLGPEIGLNGCDNVTVYVPLPIAYIVAKARRISFYDPVLKKQYIPNSLQQYAPIQGEGFGGKSPLPLKVA